MRLSTVGYLFLVPLHSGWATSAVLDGFSGRALRPHEFYCARAPSDQGHGNAPSITVKLHRGPSAQAAWFMEVVVPTAFEGRGEWAVLRAELAPQFEASCTQAQEEVAFDWSSAACAQDMMNQIEDRVRDLCVDGAAVVQYGSTSTTISDDDGGAPITARNFAKHALSPSSSSSSSGASSGGGSTFESIQQSMLHSSKGKGHGGPSPGSIDMESTRPARSVSSPNLETTGSTAQTRAAFRATIAETDAAVAAAAVTPSLSGWAAVEAEIKRLAGLVASTSSKEMKDDALEDWVSVGRSSTQRCEAMRRFSKLFMGQAAPALHALHSAARAEEDEQGGVEGGADVEATVDGLRAPPSLATTPLGGNGGATYRQAQALLEGYHFAANNASESWAALSRYALANLEHTIGAGRWDERAFPTAAARATIARGAVLVDDSDGFVSVRQDRADTRATSLLLQAMQWPMAPQLQGAGRRVSTGSHAAANQQNGNHSTSSTASSSGTEEQLKRNACVATRERRSPFSSSSSSLVHVITVASEGAGHHKLAALEASARAAGPCVVFHVLRAGSDTRGGDPLKEYATDDDDGNKDVAWGGGGWSNDWKPRRLLAFLRDQKKSASISDHDLVVFVDGYDVLLSPHIASLKEHMYAAQLNKPVTFAAERDCWPDPALCKWLTTAPYLNAGVFAGEKLHVRAMLEDMVLRLGEFGFCGEDQRAYQRYALERPDIIGLDARSAVFQCMHGHSWHVDVEPPPPTSQHESTTTTARGTTRDEQGKKEEEATRAWGTPLLHEVGHRRPANSGQSPEETTASSFKVARRPAVLHFNSYDGKEMMAQVVEALRNAA